MLGTTVIWLLILSTNSGKAVHVERFWEEKSCRSVLADIEREARNKSGFPYTHGICVSRPVQ